LAFFLSISIVLMLISNQKKNLPIHIRERTYNLIDPLRVSFPSIKEELHRFIEDFQGIEKLRSENQALRIRIEELLLQEKNYYQEMASSNQRLRELLDFKKQQPYSLIPVEVIAYAPHNYFQVIFIGKGRDEGIRKEMVVVNSQGLIGRVIEAYPHRAKVLLILDERSKIGVRDQRTRDIGILHGKGERGICELKYALSRADVRVGDRIITSGLGGLFPKGILVGEICDIKKDPNQLFQEIVVAPSVDFGKLEELFVIKTH